MWMPPRQMPATAKAPRNFEPVGRRRDSAQFRRPRTTRKRFVCKGSRGLRLTRTIEVTILRSAFIAIPIRCFEKNTEPHGTGARTHRAADGRAGPSVSARPYAGVTRGDVLL